MKLPIRGASILFRKTVDGQHLYLLGKMRYKPYRGQFSIPGGSAHSNETYWEAAVREAQEETQLSLIQPVSNWFKQKPSKPWVEQIPFIYCWQTFTVDLGENASQHFPDMGRARSEFSEMGWYLASELPEGVVPKVRRLIRRWEKSERQ